MGARSSFWGVAVVAMMLTIILCSSHSCRASVLIKANATYGGKGEATVELLIYGDTTRDLMYKDSVAKTGKTEDRNTKSCSDGAGNQMCTCGGSPDNKKQSDPFAGC